MFLKTIPKNLKSNLELLGNNPIFKQFYLAGGTALSLQLGHRISEDLDFFTNQDFLVEDIKELLEQLGSLRTDMTQKKTYLGMLNGIKISFFFYKYSLLFPPIPFLNVNIADIRDIGAMKLDAIQSRGKKRDFIDLFALFKRGLIIDDIILYFEKKYAGSDYSTQHLLKSLTYFTDAEKDDVPQLFIDYSWPEIKKYIEKEVALYLKKQIS